MTICAAPNARPASRRLVPSFSIRLLRQFRHATARRTLGGRLPFPCLLQCMGHFSLICILRIVGWLVMVADLYLHPCLCAYERIEPDAHIFDRYESDTMA